MAELEQEVKLAVLRQLGRIPKIRKERDEWRYLIRGWCQTQRVPEVCGKAEEVVEWLMANPGWQPLGATDGYKVYPAEMEEMPTEVEVTARAGIPLWYCDADNCYKIPCKVDNPFGALFSIHDGRYSEAELRMGTPPDIYAVEINECGTLTKQIPKEYEVNSRLYVSGGGRQSPYIGSVYIDLCKNGWIHVAITGYLRERVPIQTTEVKHSLW